MCNDDSCYFHVDVKLSRGYSLRVSMMVADDRECMAACCKEELIKWSLSKKPVYHPVKHFEEAVAIFENVCPSCWEVTLYDHRKLEYCTKRG